MANLTRFDPFSDAFEEFFRRMFRPARWDAEGAPTEIRVDVEETEKAYTVRAEVPGVRREDINVQIDGNVVSIGAETRREKDVRDKGRLIRSERYAGAQFRSFSLGHDIDEAEASAKYTDGILELTLPKKATVAAKRLTVQ